MKPVELVISFTWSALIFGLLNGYIDQLPWVTRATSIRLMYIGFGITIGTRLWALIGIALGGIALGYSRGDILNAQLKSIIMGAFGTFALRPPQDENGNDFYQNINMLAQLVAPLQWLFFYIAAMKSNLIRKAKVFNTTRLGALYLAYIDRFRQEHHCILLGIVVGLHIGMAFSCKLSAT